MDDKRTTSISIRLTVNELAQLKELAYVSRKSVSAYIRALIFDDDKENEK